MLDGQLNGKKKTLTNIRGGMKATKSTVISTLTGSSQYIEPAAVKRIWSRSVEKRKLCCTTFIGDGDSKSYQEVCEMYPYNEVTIHKEECLAHVSKRLKKTLCNIKKNTKNITSNSN